MDIIRTILYNILGRKLYFRYVSRCFLLFYRKGLLSSGRKFQTHYFVRKLINRGDTLIDLGANLGYYTSIFAQEAGSEGKVFAVEPVELYRDILKSNTRRYNNIEYIPYALSEEEGVAEMILPGNKKYRHGLTRIAGKDNEEEGSLFTVEKRNPQQVFKDISRLDYLKCDIEGHEGIVIPLFEDLIKKHQPIVQIEIEKSNFDLINTLFKSLLYSPYFVDGSTLKKYDGKQVYYSDLIYLPEKKINELSQLKLIS
ncbi:MAG: FkbM family methyltransferase [Marinilabiliaceae bacterium]|jgi:FkbM family methyltransferase|nr:FkbM family methyltransferase [Marinilabiliaceae bacterium]